MNDTKGTRTLAHNAGLHSRARLGVVRINLSDFSSGVYLLKVQMNNNYAEAKFLIQH